MRRCLCYPLYRNWELVKLVKEDTKCIFKLGKHCHSNVTDSICSFMVSFGYCIGKIKLLQCLISIHKVFTSTEPYHVLNNLYITDYCIWIQRSTPSVFDSLAVEIDQVSQYCIYCGVIISSTSSVNLTGEFSL